MKRFKSAPISVQRQRAKHNNRLSDVRLVAEIERAGKTQQSASGILKALVKSGDDWSNNTPQNDDVTLVVLKVK